MEVTVQQGYEGEKVVMEPQEWTKMMFSIDREMSKQRTKLAHMIAETGNQFVTAKVDTPWHRRLSQWLRQTLGFSVDSAT